MINGRSRAYPQRHPAADGRRQLVALVIMHGVLAVVTLLLTLLTALGVAAS
jgi:hypothetical protein